MRFVFSIIITVSLVVAFSAFSQSTPSVPPASAAVADDPNPAALTTAAPLQIGKRIACLSASQGKKGQEQRDQMQLCMMQARLDCLKDAIDQKIVGPQRKDFLKNCAE